MARRRGLVELVLWAGVVALGTLAMAAEAHDRRILRQPSSPTNETSEGRGVFIVQVDVSRRSDEAFGRSEAEIAGLGGVERVRSLEKLGLLLVHHTLAAQRRALWAEIAARPDVLHVEEDTEVSLDWVPNDPDLSRPETWGLEKVSAFSAWELTRGVGAVVCVVDTGVDYTHPDLAASMWVNTGEIPGNGIDDDGNGFVDDLHGIDSRTETGDPMDVYDHGTHVAGIIAAQADNGLFGAGIAPEAKIMACRYTNEQGNGYNSDVILCMEYCIDNGAHVINTSNGGAPFSGALSNAIAVAAMANVIHVASAGNDNRNIDEEPYYMGSYPSTNLLSVASSTDTDTKARWSSYGPRSVDIAAPGAGILSTLPAPYMSGTQSGVSQAVPFVSGAVALLVSRCPGARYQDVITAVLGGADPLEAFDGIVKSGGRLNAAAALQLLECSHPRPPPLQDR